VDDTVFRIYEPPYLIAATTLSHYRRPLLVDNDRVTITGVVTDLIRVMLNR